MKFTYKSGKFSSDVTITLDRQNVSGITFVGKGCYGHSEFDLDDKFIESMANCAREKTGRRFDTSDYKKWMSTGKDAGQFIAEVGISHGMHKGRTTFTQSAKTSVTLHDVVCDFLTHNLEQVFFEKDEDRKSLEEAFNLDLVKPSETAELKSVKGLINTHIGSYQKLGKKFGVFQSQERGKAINELVKSLEPIFAKTYLNIDDKETIMKLLLDTRKNVKQSHSQGSTAARLGVTKSRLATELTKVIDSLMKDKFITKDQFDALVREQKTIIQIK